MKTAQNLSKLSPDELLNVENQIARGEVFSFAQLGQKTAEPVSYTELINQRRARLQTTRG
jgi:hypothetical protein